jgi:hypothetical protein
MMLKIVAKGDVSESVADAVLICETSDFPPHCQGLMPAAVWERLKTIQANPKWVPGSMALLKDPKNKKPLKLAFKGNLQVVFANIRNEEGKISYKSIRDVLTKLRDAHERLGVQTICTVFPGVLSGREYGIQQGVVRSLLKNIFAEDNIGETSGFCLEAYE